MNREKQIEETIEFLNNRINVERNSYFGKGCITIPLIEAEKILDILKGYRKQSEGENISQMHPSDEFICEKCGLIIRECCRYEIGEDDGDEICYEFPYRFCPRCGMKVKGGEG